MIALPPGGSYGEPPTPVKVVHEYVAHPYAVGLAYHYHPGVFAKVARNRHMSLNHSVDGYASLPDCDSIGAIWLVTIADENLRLQQIDCSQYADLPAQRALRLVIEVDAATAMRLGFYAYDGYGGSGHAPAIVWHKEVK